MEAGHAQLAYKCTRLEYFTTTFITSDRGIRYLWQARMIFSGKFFTGSVPFKNIYIHATVLTKDGKRMSKSLGTGIDPLAIIEKYGADALRFGLAYQTTELQDMRFGEDTIIMGKKFANKFWNVTRYVLMKLGSDYEIKGNKPSDSEIIPKMNSMIKSVTKNIEKYIEETKDKDDQETKDTLSCLLLNCLKLLHPFIPFITEEIYSILPIENKTLIVVETWPVVQK